MVDDGWSMDGAGNPFTWSLIEVSYLVKIVSNHKITIKISKISCRYLSVYGVLELGVGLPSSAAGFFVYVGAGQTAPLQLAKSLLGLSLCNLL